MPSPRSPWSGEGVRIAFGSELPPILRHHVHRRSHGLTRRWRPVTNIPGLNKPRGGLWAAPAHVAPGKWNPILKRSAWTDWCAGEMPHWINGRYQTRLHPRRDAVFAVIDSAADARALYAAFPNHNDPVANMLRAEGIHATVAGLPLDWEAMLRHPVAGIWVTDQGIRETRLPDDQTIPSLYTWDAASVWFGEPDAFTVGETRPSPWIEPDPYDMGWTYTGQKPDLPKRMTELRAMREEMLADARQRADAMRALREEAQGETGMEGIVARLDQLIAEAEEFIAKTEADLAADGDEPDALPEG